MNVLDAELVRMWAPSDTEKLKKRHQDKDGEKNGFIKKIDESERAEKNLNQYRKESDNVKGNLGHDQYDYYEYALHQELSVRDKDSLGSISSEVSFINFSDSESKDNLNGKNGFSSDHVSVIGHEAFPGDAGNDKVVDSLKVSTLGTYSGGHEKAYFSNTSKSESVFYIQGDFPYLNKLGSHASGRFESISGQNFHFERALEGSYFVFKNNDFKSFYFEFEKGFGVNLNRVGLELLSSGLKSSSRIQSLVGKDKNKVHSANYVGYEMNSHEVRKFMIKVGLSGTDLKFYIRGGKEHFFNGLDVVKRAYNLAKENGYEIESLHFNGKRLR